MATLACALTLSLTACDSESATQVAPSPTPSSSPASSIPVTDGALCQAVAALRGSLDALTTVTIAPGMTDELTSDLNVVKVNLASVSTQARGQAQPQTDALSSALSELETAAGDLAAYPSAESVGTARTALGEVTIAARELWAVLTPNCLNASASPTG